jgi:hypothetical protein
LGSPPDPEITTKICNLAKDSTNADNEAKVSKEILKTLKLDK